METAVRIRTKEGNRDWKKKEMIYKDVEQIITEHDQKLSIRGKHQAICSPKNDVTGDIMFKNEKDNRK